METNPPTQPAGAGREFTVLIVDDEPATRKLLSEIIKRLPARCCVLEAGDAEAALQLARRSCPDLVLLDIVMPGSRTTGVTVCQELCKNHHTKVVIVSGQATDAVSQACLSMGAVEIIRKPFTVEEVEDRLKRLLPAAPG